MVTVQGVLDRITFANEENAWSVVKVEVPGKAELVTAVGNLLGVRPGENLRLSGQWISDKKYGEQFRVDSYVTVEPATLIGIERYLGSGMVPGLGKVMAERVVKHFGLSTLEVISDHANRLTEVEGIGPVRSERIRRAWVEQRQVKDVMVFLQSHGVSSAYAVKIFKEYKDRAIAIVKENPYRLATDVFGIGFKTADKIAGELGIEPTSPRRAEAGLLHVLSSLSSDEGHVYCPRDELVERTGKVLEIPPAVIEQAIVDLAARNLIVVEPQAAGPDDVYLRALHLAEQGCATRLSELMSSEVSPIRIDITRAIAWFEEKRGIELAAEQRDAIRNAVSSKVMVITGGPGTGKTTLVNAVIAILEKKARRILLTAPTGRAAKRLTETTGREAKTIHRLLQWSPKKAAFERDENSPLEADMLILDEASMVDISLMHAVLRSLPKTCQLVVVGDIDQLPSVGPGSVLGSIIRSQAVPVVRLQHIFRQASQSLIIVNAHRINQGQMPEAAAKDREADFFFIERSEPEEIVTTLKQLVSERIGPKFKLDPVEDVQVLVPMHRGILGTMNLNAELQGLLNPTGDTFVRGSRTFRVGDKVMQIRNNYDLDVFNGDIGRVTGINDTDRELTVQFDGRAVTYEYADTDELILAYARSIHKSQGSEYPCVVLPLHTQHYTMLQRNLLYTAITRARRLVIIVGSSRALALAVKNDKIERRYTRLAARLSKPSQL